MRIVFDKINNEYQEFTDKIQTEPQIYLTVLLWNSIYFQYRHQSGQMFENFFNDDFIPFTIICHAKRLTKLNLNEMSSHLYEKLNESKDIFLNLFKNCQINKQMSDISNLNKIIKKVEQQNKSSPQANKGNFNLFFSYDFRHPR